MDREDRSGQTLDGRYALLGLLGEGGMGTVYLGRHVVIGRKVAVKLLHAQLAADKGVVKRFYREAQAAAAVRHKNIIEVLDVGVAPWGDPYIVMEYLEGESLGAILARMGPIDTSQALGVMVPALEALAAAHDAGVIHRDLKPDNVFVLRPPGEEPTVKLIDFGVSKFIGADVKTQLTQTGSLLGTPAYMSPEQARGRSDVDLRSDIYSMGVILYQMLTGALPFDGDNYNAMLISSLTDPPRPPLEVFGGFPSEAEPVVMRALSKRAEDRFDSAGEMIEALAALDGFARREEGLRALSEGLVDQTFVGGDLGTTVRYEVDSDIAAEALLSVIREGTPEEWTETGRAEAPAPRRRRGLAAALAALVAAIAAGAAGVLWATGFFGGAPPDEVAPAPAEAAREPAAEPEEEAPEEEEEGVTISIEGAPDGARIYYRDALVPMNPFRTEKRGVIENLRVEADGYEPFLVAVVPSEDQTVHVELEEKRRARKAGGAKRAKGVGAAGARAPTGGADAVYSRNKRELVACYNQALASGEAPADEVLLLRMKIKIKPNGVVERVALSGGGASVPSLARCVEATVGKWIFPPSPGGSTEVFPISFTTR